MRSILHFLPVLVVFPVLADEPQPGRALSSTTYDIRDLVDRVQTLTFPDLSAASLRVEPSAAACSAMCAAFW